MTICYFGNYQKEYPRNSVLIQGLKQNDVAVLECQTRQTGFKKFISLWWQHQKIKNKYDVLIVGFAGHALMWFAKLITRKPIVFDAFVSLYLTNVEDRKTCSSKSLKAKYYAWLDKISCQLADEILLDTNAQIEYFVDKYGIKKKKFHRIFVGCDNKIFYSENSRNKKYPNGEFIVHWHGYIVPFHGFAVIFEAANILWRKKEPIIFRIITRFNVASAKYLAAVEDSRLKNIIFRQEASYRELAEAINQADCCLGIFGSNKKAKLVIANKIVEAAACAKPIITIARDVLEELFVFNKSIVVVSTDSGEDLAKKILQFRDDIRWRQEIADNAYQIYTKNLTPKILGKRLKDILGILAF